MGECLYCNVKWTDKNTQLSTIWLKTTLKSTFYKRLTEMLMLVFRAGIKVRQVTCLGHI